jgi:hypothetical protein
MSRPKTPRATPREPVQRPPHFALDPKLRTGDGVVVMRMEVLEKPEPIRSRRKQPKK